MINYVIGDVTQPVGEGHKIIAHICNDKGGWGMGFVKAISKRWLSPELNYRAWYEGKQPTMPPFQLGSIGIIPVEQDIAVANMIAQHGYSSANAPAIRYDALEQCLHAVAVMGYDSSIHMPRIGCGLAGGTWKEVEPIIQRTLIVANIPVTVYDLH
jgi:O-acetyl-ADP-ribose deacetylase (regulator of RNase III)